jgi:hypothetical protein
VRLDAILRGGLIDPSSAVVAGLPGNGKTVLAQKQDRARPAVRVRKTVPINGRRCISVPWPNL